MKTSQFHKIEKNGQKHHRALRTFFFHKTNIKMQIFAFAVWRHLHWIQNCSFINSWNLIKAPQKFIQFSFFIKLTKIWQLMAPEVFCQKSVVNNFVKFTKKHLCQSLLFNKVAGLRPLLKKRLWNMRFSVNFAKF